MNQFKKIKSLLHGELDIYENFDHTQYKNTLSPGSMPANELLQSIVSQEKPSLIIEVGSFLGWSASGMTSEMIKNNPDGVTICVDSWMGGADHWQEATFNKDSRIKRKNGYPTFYYNFLANMCYSNLQNHILPFAYPSITAAIILQNVFKENKLSADMIYIDGSHEYWDVILDLTNYYPLLKNQGIMFGDDWTCEGVRKAVTDFVNQHNLNLSVHPNQVHWFIKK
jgi:predicted O-methyltransferase YrrM